MLVVARNVSGSSSASSILIQTPMHSLQDLLISSHSEVIVGAPYSHTLVLLVLVGLRKLLGQTIDIVEIPVRLVLALLLKLGIVETLVIEFGSTAISLRWLADGLGLGESCLLSKTVIVVATYKTHHCHSQRCLPWP